MSIFTASRTNHSGFGVTSDEGTRGRSRDAHRTERNDRSRSRSFTNVNVKPSFSGLCAIADESVNGVGGASPLIE